MCGRTSLKATPAEIAEIFGLDDVPALTPRFNIAPTQPMPVVLLGRESHARELHEVRFGLVPFWEREAKGARYLNARVETVATARPFAESLKKRRCLVVVDGFYEWKKEGKLRLPYRVHFEGDQPFALAGVWDRWKSKEGDVVESCAIITGPAQGAIASMHDRMPVFVPPEAFAAWLGECADESSGDAKAPPVELLHSFTSSIPRWTLDPVSTYVNDAKHEGEACIAPPDAG